MLGYVEIRFGQSTSASYPKALQGCAAVQRLPERRARMRRTTRFGWMQPNCPRSTSICAVCGMRYPGGSRRSSSLTAGPARSTTCTPWSATWSAPTSETSPRSRPGTARNRTRAARAGAAVIYPAIKHEQDFPRYSFGVPPTGWWDFGGFDSDGRFVVRKEQIREALAKEADRAGLSFCPYYDFRARVRRGRRAAGRDRPHFCRHVGNGVRRRR